MTPSPDQPRRPKLLQNSLLAAVGLAAHMPLYYQLPRWANGLDPTFVHPDWVQQSSFPLVLHLSVTHPIIWLSIIILAFIGLCRNYGWKLSS